MQIDPLERAGLVAARALLDEQHLPTDDLDDPEVALFGAFAEGALQGVIGLQRCGELALLRSLAVTPAQRGRGLGEALCRHVLARAAARGLTGTYLLTTGAAGYFERLGFVAVERAATPDAIRGTAQFSGLCPASARVLRWPA
jgi:N-acetylglutamate synthase-like GNAT family acetyltransferase